MRSILARFVIASLIAIALALPWLQQTAAEGTSGSGRPTPDERLFDAAGAGDLEAVSEAIHAGASPDAHGRAGMTPLMCAAARGDVRVIRSLLRHGAAVNATERLGNTALFHAEMFHQERAIAVLLEHGAQEHVQQAAIR